MRRTVQHAVSGLSVVFIVLAVFLASPSQVSAQEFNGYGSGVKPAIFTSRDQLTSTSTTYSSITQALEERELETRALDRQLCAGIAADHGTSLASSFLYSQSYRSSNEQCVLASQVPCYTNDEQISAPAQKVYTRVVANVQVSGAAQFRGSPSSPLQFSINYVAADGSSTAAGQCATFRLACPSGASCQQLDDTTFIFTVSNVRVGWRMEPLCMTHTGASAYAAGIASCVMPASYVPVDGPFTGGMAPADCTGSVDCLIPGDACLVSPCEPDSYVAPATVSAILDGNCGPERDPDQGLLPELNQQCYVASCGDCPAASTAASEHVRFAAGPVSRAYQLTSPDQFMADLQVEVSRRDPVTGEYTARYVQMTDVDVGQVSMNIEGDRYVRVSILDILGDKSLAVPDLSTGALYVWNYEATADTDAAQPTPIFYQTNDPNVNPWLAYPDAGVGLTPSATNIAAAPNATGLTAGFAFIPTRSGIGSTPGSYGVAQGRLVSSAAGFGTAATCSGGDYYTRFRDVPGFDTGDEASNTAGTAGGPAPEVLSPLQCSAILNKLTADVLAGVSPDLWEEARDQCLASGYNLLRPGDYIAGNTYWRQLFDGTEYLNTPASDFLAAAPDGFVAANYVAGGVRGLADNLNRARMAITVAVDVSEDYAAYEGAASAASVSQSGTGCLISSAEGGGMATVTVENLDEVNAQTYTVVTVCAPYAGSRYGVGDLTPSQPQTIVVGANSLGQVSPPYSFPLIDFDQEGTGFGYGGDTSGAVCDDSESCSTAVASISCTFQIYPGTNVATSFPDATFTARCTDLEPPPVQNATATPVHQRIRVTASPSPLSDDGDRAVVGSGGVFIAILVALLILALCVCIFIGCAEYKKKKNSAKEKNA